MDEVAKRERRDAISGDEGACAAQDECAAHPDGCETSVRPCAGPFASGTLCSTPASSFVPFVWNWSLM